MSTVSRAGEASSTDFAGAIIVHGILGLDWDIAHCTRFFCEYASRTLNEPPVGNKLRPGAVRSLISCLFNGGHYHPEAVTSALRECVGSWVRLFDYPMSGTSRCKIAVTATTTDDASTVLFPNYNLCVRDEKCDGNETGQPVLATYHRFPRDSPKVEPRLWEV